MFEVIAGTVELRLSNGHEIALGPYETPTFALQVMASLAERLWTQAQASADSSVEPDGLGWATLHHGVGKLSDPFDGDAHGVTGRQETWRVESGAHTGGRSSGDDGARLERERRREVLDHLGTAEDQVGRGRVLAQLVVHP